MDSHPGLERLRLAHSLATEGIEKTLGWKFNIPREVLDLQTQLLERYARTDRARQLAAVGPPHNVVLVNAVSNSIYFALGSIQQLEQGFLGASCCMHPPWFEGLLIAKETTVNPDFIDRWKAQHEDRADPERISVHHDIFVPRGFREGEGNIGELVRFWRELHKVTHHTMYAGPPLASLHFPAKIWTGSNISTTVEDWLVDLCNNVEHAADATFALLDMTAHLITPHMRKKGKSFRETYGEHPEAEFSERELREQLTDRISEHWERECGEERET